MSIFTRLVLLLWTMFTVTPAAASDLAVPTGPPLLTVTGAVTQTNTGDAAVFDRAMLEALPSVTFTTGTIWTDRAHSFTGIPLAALLAHVGATGQAIAATAINDYAVTIPMEDAMAEGPIVAYLIDGSPMSVRDKGPLWVVYPFDSDPAFQSEVVYSRSIWQLDRIVVTQ